MLTVSTIFAPIVFKRLLFKKLFRLSIDVGHQIFSFFNDFTQKISEKKKMVNVHVNNSYNFFRFVLALLSI